MKSLQCHLPDIDELFMTGLLITSVSLTALRGLHEPSSLNWISVQPADC